MTSAVNLCGCADSQLAVFELDQALDAAIHQQVFVSGNFTLHVQAGAQPRGSAVGRGCQRA